MINEILPTGCKFVLRIIYKVKMTYCRVQFLTRQNLVLFPWDDDWKYIITGFPRPEKPGIIYLTSTLPNNYTCSIIMKFRI